MLYNIINNKYNNKLLYYSYGTYSGFIYFQNPALNGESNPHAILIRIWFFSNLKL